LTDNDLCEKIIEGGYFTALKYTKENEWNNLEKMIYEFCEGKIELNIEIAGSNDDVFKNKILTLLNMTNAEIKNGNYKDAFALINELMNKYSENEIKKAGIQNAICKTLPGILLW
jgi:hypothetical protein